jgi:hypothetical protein
MGPDTIQIATIEPAPANAHRDPIYDEAALANRPNRSFEVGGDLLSFGTGGFLLIFFFIFSAMGHLEIWSHIRRSAADVCSVQRRYIQEGHLARLPRSWGAVREP